MKPFTHWLTLIVAAMLILAVIALRGELDAQRADIEYLEQQIIMQGNENAHHSEQIQELENVPGCWDINIPKP